MFVCWFNDPGLSVTSCLPDPFGAVSFWLGYALNSNLLPSKSSVQLKPPLSLLPQEPPQLKELNYHHLICFHLGLT